MIASRVTFYLASQGIPGWQLNELKNLAGLFRSVIVLVNVAQCKRANIEHSLKLMSIKNCAGDMCQLIIEGLDAELACMVFSEYFSENHYLIATTHSQKRMSEEVLNNLPIKSLTVPLLWSFIETIATCKQELLAHAALEACPARADQLLEALLNREAISSTLIGEKVALPHVMHASVDELSVIIQFTDYSIEWAEGKANPELVVTLLVPANKDRDTLQACTRFTRWLLIPENQQLLIDNRDEFILKAMVSHVMACYSPAV